VLRRVGKSEQQDDWRIKGTFSRRDARDSFEGFLGGAAGNGREWRVRARSAKMAGDGEGGRITKPWV
jgi:hypothetical protein